MERIFGLKKAAGFPGSIATLGVFDGVHRGHQEVLAGTVQWAGEKRVPCVVITFDRHPEAVLRRKHPAALTSLEHRLSLIEAAGIDVALVLHFDESLAAMEPEQFVREILVDHLHVGGVVLGFNGRFGKGARGDLALLQELGVRHGFEVRSAPPLVVDGAPVSSSRVRKLVTAGRLPEASGLLGRPVSLLGTVVHGQKRGRNLGFPTANLNLHHEVTPPSGVYICRVKAGGQTRWGLVNIGTRPTFERPGVPRRKAVEVFIDGYAGDDLYGKALEVEIASFVRPERKFDSAENLTRQMKKDLRFMRSFSRTTPGENPS